MRKSANKKHRPQVYFVQRRSVYPEFCRFGKTLDPPKTGVIQCSLPMRFNPFTARCLHAGFGQIPFDRQEPILYNLQQSGVCAQTAKSLNLAKRDRSVKRREPINRLTTIYLFIQLFSIAFQRNSYNWIVDKLRCNIITYLFPLFIQYSR